MKHITDVSTDEYFICFESNEVFDKQIHIRNQYPFDICGVSQKHCNI